MNSISRHSGSVLRRKQILTMLFLIGLVFSPCRAIVGQQDRSWLQGQNPEQQDQELNDTTRPQSGDSTGSQSDQGLDSQTMPGQSTQNQSRQSQSTQSESAQSQITEFDQATGSATMSSEQIISILKQEPLILTSIKEQVAQQTGMDPTSITDQSLYQRIRQSQAVRVLATKELVTRGYSVDQTMGAQTQEGTQNTPSSRQGKQITREQGRPYESPDSPQVRYRISPYTNLPSMADLYAQFPSMRPKLKRFGSDAFLIGPGNTNDLPMDLPAGPDYVLGPGDSLTLNLWGGRPDRLIRTVDRQGQVELPETGTVMVAGMTVAQAQVAMEKALSTQFQNEHVEIALGRIRTVRVYVVGDVQRPGAYDVSSLSTPLSALYEAGGPTSRGSLRILRQYRGKQLIKEFDLYDFLLRGVRSEDEKLLPGDTILVPPAGPQVAVEGMVRRPAIYELNGEQGLDEVLNLSGGLLVSASLKKVDVERIEAHERRTMFSLQLPDNSNELHEKLAGFKVKDGDDVVISQILPYNAEAVYLEGHVFHPGKFPYRDGMTIADLLHSYQDVLPEPSDHAELVRLQPPDLRPTTISFNLHDVLVGNDNISLRPFDLIRIYGRYEMDSPKVSIQGEVLRPGEYPMSEGMTVAGLVKQAGGFRRSAYRDEADLSTYTIQNGEKVVIDHKSVAVEKAIEGDKNADVTLKPGDVVSIRRLSGWQDIGMSVQVTGEVALAGSYGITEGERLSSVLKRAGGFRPQAFPQAAVLQRIQVRDLGEQARQQMIQRIEDTPLEVKRTALSGSNVSDLQQSLQAQRQDVLRSLRNHTASGRLVIRISADISSWENTSADVELRAGDTIFIPKRPNFVAVSGQVFNPVAITYTPGKTLGWYLKRAGGATQAGNKKNIYVLRADGSVAPRDDGWLRGGFMGTRILPGDTIFVPEKVVGGSVVWQNILGAAQIMSASMLPLAVAGVI